MICFGTHGRRRIGFHRDINIGRATQYGARVLQIHVCFWCGRSTVIG
jgi:hypothetical protein